MNVNDQLDLGSLTTTTVLVAMFARTFGMRQREIRNELHQKCAAMQNSSWAPKKTSRGNSFRSIQNKNTISNV